MANAIGRPTKYIPEVIYPIIESYLESCSKEQTELPTTEGLAQKLGVNTDTLFEWNKKHPEFSEYLKRLADKQRNQLMNDGMYGGKEVNASMAIFLLKAIHGLKDNSGISIDKANILVMPSELIDKYKIANELPSQPSISS